MIEFYFKINDAKEVRIGEEMHAKDAKLTLNIEKDGDMEFKDNNGNTFTLFTKEVDKLCEEFTASKMRKIADEQNCEADKRMVKQVEVSIKNKANQGCSMYFIDKHLSEYVKNHFILRGFSVEEKCGMYEHGTRISW